MGRRQQHLFVVSGAMLTLQTADQSALCLSSVQRSPVFIITGNLQAMLAYFPSAITASKKMNYEHAVVRYT